ncbi:hypothetical protein HK102_006342, partial [Quaeritorhiza haematococci]
KIDWEMNSKQRKIPRARVIRRKAGRGGLEGASSLSIQAQRKKQRQQQYRQQQQEHQQQQHRQERIVMEKSAGDSDGGLGGAGTVHVVDRPVAGLEPSIRKVVLMQNLLTTAQKKYEENVNEWRYRLRAYQYMMEVQNQMQRDADAAAAVVGCCEYCDEERYDIAAGGAASQVTVHVGDREQQIRHNAAAAYHQSQHHRPPYAF